MHRPYRDNPSTHADNLTESDIKYEGRKPPCQCYQRNRSGHSYISQHVLLTVLDGWATDDGQTGTVWTLSFHLVWEKTSPISNHGQTLWGYSSRTTNSELTINIRSGNGHCRWMTSATSVQFNSVPWPISLLGWGERHETRFSRDSVPVFSVGGHHEQFWYVKGCPVFEVVHTVFPLPTTRPTEICQCLTDLHRITLLCDKFHVMINMAFNTSGWQFEPWTHLSKQKGGEHP